MDFEEILQYFAMILWGLVALSVAFLFFALGYSVLFK